MVKNLFAAAVLAGLGLSGLVTPGRADACDVCRQLFEERRISEYTGVLHLDFCGTKPVQRITGWSLKTDDGVFQVSFSSRSASRQAMKFVNQRVKVKAQLTVSGLMVHEIEAAK